MSNDLYTYTYHYMCRCGVAWQLDLRGYVGIWSTSGQSINVYTYSRYSVPITTCTRTVAQYALDLTHKHRPYSFGLLPRHRRLI
jgi:hypothetical protein